MKNKKSIRNKMIVSYMSIIFIAIVMFTAITLIHSSKITKVQNMGFVSQMLELARGNIYTRMQDVEITIDNIQANRSIINSVNAINEDGDYSKIGIVENELQNIDIYHQKISKIRIYTLGQAEITDVYSSENVYGYCSCENEPWFKKTRDKDGATNWNMFYDSAARGTFTASRMLYEPRKEKNPIGVVRIDIDILPFLEQIDNIKIGETGKIFLVQDNSIITVDKESFLKDIVNERKFFSCIKGELDGYTKINGKYYLIAYDNLEKTNLTIAAMVEANEIDEMAKTIKKSMLETAVLCIIIGFVIVIFISRVISEPIIKLSHVMKNFENDTNVRVHTKSENEIGTLYNSFNKMMSRIGDMIRDINELNTKQKNAELKILQAQINPHFLYNTLESINWMAVSVGADEISLMVSSLGSFFRHSLNNGKEFLSVENEIKQVKSFIAIEKIRFKDKFDIEYDIDEKIMQYHILKLTLQPLVENCIVHGFDRIDYKGMIKITGREHEKGVCFEIEDNGLGADTDFLNHYINDENVVVSKKGKYGVRNVQKRIKLYFGDEYGVRFESNEYGGVTARVIIAKESEKKMNGGEEKKIYD